MNVERASARRGFASDNAATVHPQVLAAIAAANDGHAFGYGHDPYTRSVEERIADVFGEDVRSFFVFNGSGANVLALRAACRGWHAALCTDVAHLNVDEGGAPETIAGVKLLTAPHVDGKLTLEALRRLIARVGDEHAVQPRVVSITQSSEFGTVYGIDEMRAIADLAHEEGLLLHVDGARLANAAAALDTGLREVSFGAGADLVSFGGTKNGLLLGEALLVRDPRLADALLYLRKGTLQLASKMRFIAAQFDALLANRLWWENAGHANAMARRLAEAVGRVDGVRITRPVEANAVFALLPPAAADALLAGFDFYVWDETIGEVRWMCSWDTTPDDVDAFAAAVGDAVAGAGGRGDRADGVWVGGGPDLGAAPGPGYSPGA